MKHEELLKYIATEEAAIKARRKAEAEFLRTNGIPVGAKVRVMTRIASNKIGIVSKKEYAGEIRYAVNKITNGGKMHKTSRLDFYLSESDLEVIEE